MDGQQSAIDYLPDWYDEDERAEYEKQENDDDAYGHCEQCGAVVPKECYCNEAGDWNWEEEFKKEAELEGYDRRNDPAERERAEIRAGWNPSP